LFGGRDQTPRVAGPRSVEYYRELKRGHLIRLFASYAAPLVTLAAFSYFRYDLLENRAKRDHIMAVAADRARMLDLCLEERLSDLTHLAGSSVLPDNKELRKLDENPKSAPLTVPSRVSDLLLINCHTTSDSRVADSKKVSASRLIRALIGPITILLTFDRYESGK